MIPKTIVPSRQLAPLGGAGNSAIVTGDPPETGIFFSVRPPGKVGDPCPVRRKDRLNGIFVRPTNRLRVHAIHGAQVQVQVGVVHDLRAVRRNRHDMSARASEGLAFRERKREPRNDVALRRRMHEPPDEPAGRERPVRSAAATHIRARSGAA